MNGRKNIQAEDGTILEVQEGVVVSADGEPVAQAANAPARSSRWWLPLAGAILVPAILFAGFAIVGVIAAILLAFWVLRAFLSILGIGGGPRPRASFTYVVKRGR